MDYEYKLTTHGRSVVAACMAMETPLRITRVAFGSSKVDEKTNLADVHQLLKYVTDGTVAERQHEDDRFYLTIQYANVAHPDVKTFMLTEFIVYAQNPENGEDTDLLYGTLGDYRQPVPAYNPTYPPSVFNFPLTLIISDEVNVAISAPAGLVTYQDLYTAVAEAGSAEVLDFTLPATGWVKDGNGVRLDMAHSHITKHHIPFASFSRNNQPAVSACGLEPVVEAADGVLRFWAAIPPAAPIPVTVSLFLPRGLFPMENMGGGTIPTATANSLGGIKGSDTLVIDPDGTAHVRLSEESFSSDEEVAAAMQDVFGE